MSHKHEFTGLWTHFGPYGDQTVHYHVCFTEDCARVLIGDGRDCHPETKHRRMWLTENGPVARLPAPDTEGRERIRQAAVVDEVAAGSPIRGGPRAKFDRPTGEDE